MNRETIDVRDFLDAHKGCRLQWTVVALIFMYCLVDGFDATVIGFLAVLSSYRQKDEQGRSELAIDGLTAPCWRTRPFPRPRWPGRAPRVCAARCGCNGTPWTYSKRRCHVGRGVCVTWMR
jgi:hypothetical protein